MIARNHITLPSDKWHGPVAYAAMTLIGVAGLIATGAGVVYLLPTDLSLDSIVTNPLEPALAFGVLGITFACAWLYSIVRRPVHTLTRRGILLGYLALWALGLFSLLMLEYYHQLHYPIAQYEVLPTTSMIQKLILWDTIGCVALAYGLWLGSFLVRRSSRPPANLSKQQTTSLQSIDDGSPLLATWGKRLFLVGLIGSIILVGTTHSIALFDPNIDAVRYSQGAGIGFATLGQYELISSAVIGLSLIIQSGPYRRVGVLLASLSLLVLIATRAERTSILIVAFAALILARLMGKRPRLVPTFLIVITLVSVVLYLGVFRLQSQESSPISGKERQTRALLDISPEVREQSFVFTVFPSQAHYLGANGVLPVGLALLPGKVLSLAGIDKQTLNQDSSRFYTATMDNLGIYAASKPIRVGLAGELWMDAGPAGLIIGMVLYGILGTWLTAWRPRTPLRLVGRALAATFLVLSLITPLAALSPIALVTLLPLLLARDGKPIPIIDNTMAAHHLQPAKI